MSEDSRSERLNSSSDYITRYENDLSKLREGIKGELSIHAELAKKFKKMDRRFLLLIKTIASFSALFSALTMLDTEYKYWFNLATVAVAFATAITTGYYEVYSPGEKRIDHIDAIGQKSGIMTKITHQLIARPEDKESYDTFYDWIYDEYADVSSRTPFI